MAGPNILVLDIETVPATVRVFGLFKQNIGVDQIVAPSRMCSFGAKWLGSKQMIYADVFGTKNIRAQRRKMLLTVQDAFDRADAVVTFNGDAFDLPKLRGEMMAEGFPPLPPVTSLDVRHTTSAMGFTSGRLQYVAPFLGCGEKERTGGFPLWADYMDGCPDARSEMRTYNLKDVTVLEDVYLKVRGHMRRHAPIHDEGCPVCGSFDTKRSNKVRRTPCFKVALNHCRDCGHWWDGKRTRII